MVGVGILLAQLLHGALKGGSLALAAPDAPIKAAHKVCRASIVDVPQGQEQRLRARVEKPTDQTEQFVARSDDIQSRCAATQGDEFGFELELVEIVQAQICSAKANP